jgi:hypothetical protein
MRPFLFGLFAFLVAATTASADTKVSGATPAPLSFLAQPWIGRVHSDAARLLPRTTRTEYPASGLGDVYWGAITDEATWRALLKKDPHLSFFPPIDFRKDAVIFVLHDTHGGGGGIDFKGFTLDRDGGHQLSINVHPATLDIAYESRTVLMMRVARAGVSHVRLETRGKIFGEQFIGERSGK